jgi:hypothetical protein
MGNTGVGMLLGDLSVKGVWIMWIGAFVLGGALLYGVLRTGRLSRRERAQLDSSTEGAQLRDDPQKQRNGRI